MLAHLVSYCSELKVDRRSLDKIMLVYVQMSLTLHQKSKAPTLVRLLKALKINSYPRYS